MSLEVYSPLSFIGLKVAAAEILQMGDNGLDDPKFVKKIQRRINEAQAEFTQANPDGLLLRTFRQYLPKHTTSRAEGFLFINTDDPLVLEIRKANGDELDTGTDTTGWLPDISGRWNGLMWLEVDTDSTTAVSGNNPTKLFNVQTREWWRTGGGIAGPYRYFVSLWYPYPGFSTGDDPNLNIPGRIYARYLYFPQQIMRPHGTPRIYRPGTVPMRIQDPLELQNNIGEVYNGTSTGIPHTLARASTVSHQAVNFTPTTTTTQTAWVGPVQEGKFRFRVTVSMGQHSSYHYDGGATQIPWPLFETGPSPESAVFDHALNTGKAIIIKLPNIDFLEGFYPSSAERYLRSGWEVNIYVSRTGIRAAGLGDVNQVEVATPYELLARVSVDGDDPTYTWTGSVIPSRSQRLHYHSGTYDGYLVYPNPVEDYTIEWPVIELPKSLQIDTDEVPIRPEFGPAFRELFIAHVALQDGRDTERAAYARQTYMNLISQMRAQNRGTARTKMSTSTGGLSMWEYERIVNYDIGTPENL